MQKNLFFFLFTFILLNTCTQKPKTAVVASWKGHNLYADEFQKMYIAYASANPIRDNQALRKRYAEYKLEQKIIANIAQNNGLDTLKEVKIDVKLKKDNVLRQQYMRSIMDSRVKKPEEMEIREAFRKKSTGILLEQIFSKTAAEIDSLDKLLKSGKKFEDLAINSMRKYNPNQPDTTYKMGWITYGEMDLAPEEVAFSLKEGQRSKPVKSFNGWHIFRAAKIRSTTNVDISAYQNERENLSNNLYRRRFEEATQHYLDSTLQSLPLSINNKTLQKVWGKIEPWIKKANPENLAIILTIECAKYSDSDLPRTTPLAQVDGATYTVGQFIDHLQTVPAFMIQSNLTEAVEFALKNSIFAKRAELNGYNENSIVELEERTAKIIGLYYAKLRKTVDTLNTERLKDEYYEKWKETYFIDTMITTFKAYVYKDSANVWKTINAWQKSRNFKQAVEESSAHLRIETRTTRAALADINGIPEHNLPMDSDKMDQVFAGPYDDIDGTVILIAPVSRSYVFIPRENANERLDEVVTKNLSSVTHEQILPAEYSKSAVVYNLEALDGIVPYYSESASQKMK